jgi:hypothetical protein
MDTKKLSSLIKARREDVLLLFKDYNITAEPTLESVFSAFVIYKEPFLAKFYDIVWKESKLQDSFLGIKLFPNKDDAGTMGPDEFDFNDEKVKGEGWTNFLNIFSQAVTGVKQGAEAGMSVSEMINSFFNKTPTAEIINPVEPKQAGLVNFKSPVVIIGIVLIIIVIVVVINKPKTK